MFREAIIRWLKLDDRYEEKLLLRTTMVKFHDFLTAEPFPKMPVEEVLGSLEERAASAFDPAKRPSSDNLSQLVKLVPALSEETTPRYQER